MPTTASNPECIFEGDKFEKYLRKCIIFPADGSATQTKLMVVETMTIAQDITALRLYSRCVDLSSTFGAEHRNLQTRATPLSVSVSNIAHAYLFFYKCSLRLPINLNVAELVGVSASHLKTKKHLFWRGDIVVMKVQRMPKLYGYSRVEPLDADLSALGALEELLRVKHQEGFLEQELYYEEMRWKSHVERLGDPGDLEKQKSYWGENPAQREEHSFTVINEQRSAIGRAPLLRPRFLKSPVKSTATSSLPDVIYSSFQSAFRYLLGQEIAGPPQLPLELPLELERQIFETCALEFPEVCTTLVLVSKRVYTWIDPILISTVCLMHEQFTFGKQSKLGSFLAKLTSGKNPVEYYVQHVKSLAFFGGYYKEREIDGILAICTGVENLVVDAADMRYTCFNRLLASTALRRLYIDLRSTTSGSAMPLSFNHPCFRNLTHLHLMDNDEDWASYTGWEHLECLTHLAFALCTPNKLQTVMQALPAVRYVAHGYYQWLGERYRRANVLVNNDPHIRELWGAHVVFLTKIPLCDWEQGARGEGDFWDVVEDEVKKRLQDDLD